MKRGVGTDGENREMEREFCMCVFLHVYTQRTILLQYNFICKYAAITFFRERGGKGERKRQKGRGDKMGLVPR